MGHKKRTWPEEPAPLAAPVMDNHTHLPVHTGEIPTADGVKLDLAEQIRRARTAGVALQLSSACEIPDFDPMLQIARAHEGVRVALALHPNEAALHAGVEEPSPDGLVPRRKAHHVPLDEALAEVEARLADPMVVAVGETGLDYYRTAEEGRAAQKRAFAAHLELAAAAGLPLQIHDREAHADCLEVLGQVATPDQGIVFHCFSGDGELARALAAHGWYASFAGPITYPANEGLREGLAAMPRDLVLVETDAPYLTPAPHRGAPNASYVMVHTVRFIADLWGVGEAEACDQLMANSRRVYGTW
ncbi:TatD family hydrolase [Actinomyces culturomici]|uniref:TatD family hydrolase n=1 Tax=Actinomyces culturomici TaxID=1926276 RepID=UPI000E204002|nr:TatD family hydrolase [Actinomyces culturomici]